MKKTEFKNLFELHWKWQMGVFTSKRREEKGFVCNFTYLNNEYFDVVLPNLPDSDEIDLKLVQKIFDEEKRVPSFYLIEDYQKNGLVETLIRSGYHFLDDDTWMVLDNNSFVKDKIKSEIVNITPQNFGDYNEVLSTVFSDFPSNGKYLEICKESLSKINHEEIVDLKSELYLIYQDDHPASGAGMFYSVKENFAYLHDAGTLEKFRGRGYQTDLIRHRSNKAIELGITRIYSLVEQGGQSWTNMIKSGFGQEQVANIISLNK